MTETQNPPESMVGYAIVPNFTSYSPQEMTEILLSVQAQITARPTSKMSDWTHHQHISYILRHSSYLQEFKRCYPVTWLKLSCDKLSSKQHDKLLRVMQLAQDHGKSDVVRRREMVRIMSKRKEPIDTTSEFCDLSVKGTVNSTTNTPK